jgi:integrase
MIKIQFNIRTLIDKRDNRVIVRVRWNQKTNEVGFTTGLYAQEDKWDFLNQKAIKGTVHVVNGNKFTAYDINDRICEFQEEIRKVFSIYEMNNTVPTPSELKMMVNRELGRIEESPQTEKQKKTSLKILLNRFLKERGNEKNWDDDCKEKYTQAYQHITAAVPSVTPYNITIDTMYKLRDWYVKNEYKNRTINKQVVMLKSFLRWINQQEGFSIPDTVLNFSTNLKVMRKTVTFLHYEELLHFASFQFENNDERLGRARDLWCFMAFTSLRFSDLSNLKTGHISNNRIDMMTQKTSDHISIPLTDGAVAILNKYKGKETADGYVFDVPSNQKLNDAIKDAAKAAGLNRIIVETYYVGTKRMEEQHAFCDIISCHDARRTFVSCSLAMSIPAQVVMKCTGHKGYNTMKPYIETATETQALEMEKWNRSQYRSQIISLLDKADENRLKEILDFCKIEKPSLLPPAS